MWNKIRKVLMIILAVAFLGSAGTVVFVKSRYRINDRIYSQAAAQFTMAAQQPRAEGSTTGQADSRADLETNSKAAEIDANGTPGVEGGQTPEKPKKPHVIEYAPIRVDFESLLEAGDEVVGWIYCEDSVINYPILQGEDNDYYLYNDYRGHYTVFGSIFADANNQRDFQDYNTIIYGHHMQNDSMFGSIDYWFEQSYYDEHPVMWLLTPERDYKIVLFSGYHTSAYSDTFQIFSEPGKELDEYLQKALEQSAFETEIEFDEDAHYVLLSTCAYVFNYARSVLHGMLIPLDSAGGIPIDYPDT